MKRCARLVLLGLSLVLPACGGGGDDSGSSSTDADEETAQAANWRLSDFPPGWERDPAALRRPDSPDDLRFSACMGRPPAAELRTAIADSDNFSTGEFTRANSSAQVMRTEAIAREDLAVLLTEKALPCLRDRLQAELRGQTPPGGPPFELLTLERSEFPHVGDDTVSFRMTVAAPAVAAGATLVVDQVFVRKGRVEISTAFVHREQPLPGDLEESLVRKLVERAS
ncbi:MAG: hypothetical protein ABR540_01395 [Acidimicrobiales bacterium]